MKTRKISKSCFISQSIIYCLFQSSVSAVSVLKTYRYDWNFYYKSSMNYHNHQYISIPSWSCYYSYSGYQIGGGWNYDRYEVIKYY